MKRYKLDILFYNFLTKIQNKLSIKSNNSNNKHFDNHTKTLFKIYINYY